MQFYSYSYSNSHSRSILIDFDGHVKPVRNGIVGGGRNIIETCSRKILERLLEYTLVLKFVEKELAFTKETKTWVIPMDL